jgi:hypothetical protein
MPAGIVAWAKCRNAIRELWSARYIVGLAPCNEFRLFFDAGQTDEVQFIRIYIYGQSERSSGLHGFTDVVFDLDGNYLRQDVWMAGESALQLRSDGTFGLL